LQDRRFDGYLLRKGLGGKNTWHYLIFRQPRNWKQGFEGLEEFNQEGLPKGGSSNWGTLVVLF